MHWHQRKLLAELRVLALGRERRAVVLSVLSELVPRIAQLLLCLLSPPQPLLCKRLSLLARIQGCALRRVRRIAEKVDLLLLLQSRLRLVARLVQLRPRLLQLHPRLLQLHQLRLRPCACSSSASARRSAAWLSQ